MPVITSLLDNDFYAFTMGQVVWKCFPDVRVKYQFTNRTKAVPLARELDLQALRREIAAVRQLRFSEPQLTYLQNLGCFEAGYLDYLRTLELPKVTVRAAANGQLNLHYEGSWAAGIFWETMLLALVNELHYRHVVAARGLDIGQLEAEGRRRLTAKVELLHRQPDIRFVEFGSRRRFSRDWQHCVTRQLQQAVPDQLAGTSNVALACELGLEPVGTMAHQLFMVTTALRVAAGHPDPIRAAQTQVLDLWERQYAGWRDGRLLVFLSDTYGSATFFDYLEPGRLDRWTGLRQDSGDPVTEGARWVDYLRQQGRNSAGFRLTPSDGLTFEAIAALHQRFGREIATSFGWGTNLTNDLGIDSLSQVIKPVLANGQPCAKLSDNPAKATGLASEVERLRKMAPKAGTAYIPCVY